MEQLTEELTIEQASIEEWTHRRTKKEGMKVNFTISSPLPKLLANQLRCAAIYEADTGKMDLLHKLKDTELVIPIPGTDAVATFFPDVLYCFRARREEQQFSLEFAVHVSVRSEEIHEILKGSPELISISIRPRQGQLFEGGTRVDASGADCTRSPETSSLASADAMGEPTHQGKRKPRADKSTVN